MHKDSLYPTRIKVKEMFSICLVSPQFSSVGCGHSRSCLRDPADCQPESDPHCFFLAFTTGEAGQSVMFELSGPAEGYVSFALSLDKWMVGIKMDDVEYLRNHISHNSKVDYTIYNNNIYTNGDILSHPSSISS